MTKQPSSTNILKGKDLVKILHMNKTLYCDCGKVSRPFLKQIFLFANNTSFLNDPMEFWAQLNFSGPEFIFAKFWEIYYIKSSGSQFLNVQLYLI
jgi:hypothetical protein